MNGIDHSTLFGNPGLFSDRASNKNEVDLFTNVNKKAQNRTTSDKKQRSADRDTYEYTGGARDVKAGYSKPQRTESTGTKSYKPIDANGIQEGVQLSDAAKDLLAELRAKYTNMDIRAAEWSSDEEQDYYASTTSKDYSVLINPELLEKMASDDAVRAEYEAVLGGAGDKFEELKEGLGEDADKVSGFNITIDKEGKVSYAIQLLKDLNESSKADKKESAAKAQEERINEKREERKRLEKERLEKVVEKKRETEKITAGSIEELVAAVKAKLHPDQYGSSEDAEKAAQGITG